MRQDGTPRTSALSRRSFLALATAAVGSRLVPAWAAEADRRAGASPPPEGDHTLALRVPRLTANGAKVPILVEAEHPMTAAHHVTIVRVRNDGDPISSKGTFHFTAASGRVYLAFQARMHEGISEVTATAECSGGRSFSASSPIEIPPGAGGCLGSGPPKVGRAPGEDIGPPVLRIAELVERGAIRRGEIVHVQLKMRHPNRTGLALRNGAMVRESEPIHVDSIDVLYDDEPVSRFAMTSALSDDPLIGFALLARREGKLRVVVTNNRGQRLEATHEIHLA